MRFFNSTRPLGRGLLPDHARITDTSANRGNPAGIASLRPTNCNRCRVAQPSGLQTWSGALGPCARARCACAQLQAPARVRSAQLQARSATPSAPWSPRAACWAPTSPSSCTSWTSRLPPRCAPAGSCDGRALQQLDAPRHARRRTFGQRGAPATDVSIRTRACSQARGPAAKTHVCRRARLPLLTRPPGPGGRQDGAA